MKKLLVLGVVLMLLSPAFAQPEDGDVILGGSLRILSDGGSTKDEDGNVIKDDDKVFEFNIGPHVHYMLSEHMSVGGTIFYSLSRSTDFVYPDGPDGDEIKEKDRTSGFGLAPSFRYWWQIGEKKKFGLFAEAGVGFATFGGTDEEYDAFEDEVVSTDFDRTNRVYVYAYPGMYYAPAKCFFFEIQFGGFGLNYRHDSRKVGDTDVKVRESRFDIGGDLDEMFFGNTAIGFNFVF